ncbi:MAG: hypothetical protein QOF35_2220 [Actinomycetota bacterium]|nr:hypothetical protein [Actinomycetota bacterium]
MAVKKAASAKRAVPQKKAVPTRVTSTKSSAPKATAKKAAAKPGAAKSGLRKVTAKKATAKQGAAKSGPSKAPVRKAPPKPAATTPGKSSAPQNAAAVRTKASASKTTASKTTATKTTASKTSTKAPSTRATAKRASATKPGVTKAPNGTSGSKSRPEAATVNASAQPQRLRVRGNEKPWTAKELASVRADLEADLARLESEISMAEVDLAGLMRDAGDGAGDDQADAGTATFEREQEISLANNAREVYEQSARALGRLIDGSYGVCESCGSPIGKNRLLAFPRATLCMTCKSKQERR